MPPNRLKKFLTIASIAEMGGSRAGPTKEQPGASRQRSSREREPADKGAEPRDPRVATIQGCFWGPQSNGGHYPRVDHGSTIQGCTQFPFMIQHQMTSILPHMCISSKPILKLFAPTIAMPCKTTYSNTFMQCCTCKETKYGQYHNLGH